MRASIQLRERQERALSTARMAFREDGKPLLQPDERSATRLFTPCHRDGARPCRRRNVASNHASSAGCARTGGAATLGTLDRWSGGDTPDDDQARVGGGVQPAGSAGGGKPTRGTGRARVRRFVGVFGAA